MLEEKILYKVLLQILKRENVTMAPDNEYLRALETIGIIKLDWDYSLTGFGYSLFNLLDRKLNC